MASFIPSFSMRLALLLLAANIQPASAADAPVSVSSEPAAVSVVNPPVPSTIKLDPQVKKILTAAVNFYANVQNFEVDIDSVMHIQTAMMNKTMDSPFHVALQRPGSFSIVAKAGLSGGTLVSNGKTLITYVSKLNKYTSADAPADLSELLSPVNLAFVEGVLPLGFEGFFQKDPIKDSEDGLLKSEYVGPEKIGGLPAQHIRLADKNFVDDFWIADGPQPLLLQIQTTPDMSGAMKGMSDEQKKKLPPGMESMKMTRTSTYTNWHVNQPVAAAIFQFQPPPEAKLVTKFFKRPPHPLVGKMAPDFQLNDVNGKPVKLSDLHGKFVVIDFWATWCGPCVASLPIVTQATSARKTQGVVFYAVNLRESIDKIRAFQKDKNLDFPVLLDSDGKVARLYQAKGIPQSVLIDKNSKIEAIHVGYTSGLKKELSQQLDDMIAGKSLLPDTVPSAPAKGP